MDRGLEPWLDDEFWDEIVRDSEARLAAPAVFAAEVLERLFLYESDKERGFARWDDAIAAGLWWADDAVACLRAVVGGAQTGEALGAWVRAHAGVVWVDGLGGGAPGDEAAHAAWLFATVPRLEAAFAAAVARLRAARAVEAD